MEDGFPQKTAVKILKLEFFKRLKKQIFPYKERLLVLVGVILVGVLSFEAGALHSSIGQSEPLVVSLPAVEGVVSEKEVSSGEKILSAGLERTASQIKDTELPKGCVFVGSRNSDKYHLPTCASAKRIKPENKVCFASKEDAEKRGYLAGCLK